MADTPERPRLLIFVIAYYAEATLESVLERIPLLLFEQFRCEILVVDDASEDRTFQIGRAYKRRHPELPLTVLRNAYNQGYGGNQKVGYAYAMAEGFDFVAMVHGDGQYAPEELPKLCAPLKDGSADAVFGSRMLERGGALKGGMPLYKYVGNKILTTAQNALLGSTLSEFHSGYRVYRVSALARLPIAINSNDFHFDTEIIIQLMNARMRIVELPIPTYYGDTVSRVQGLKYARAVMAATVKNRFHRAGLLYQRRFDTDPDDGRRYASKLGYASSHEWALEAVPAGAKVLDLGSGSPELAQALRQKGCTVTQVAPDDVEKQTYDLGGYDCLLLLDIIAHVRSPERFLARLRQQFDHRPRKVLLSTPNVAFFIPRLMMLGGQFNYVKAGILDLTHTRLFTFASLRYLLDDHGFAIKRIAGVPAPFPKAFGDGAVARGAVAANLRLIGLSRTLFGYQIFVEAETTPDVAFLLEDAKRSGKGAVTRLVPSSTAAASKAQATKK